MTTATGDTLSTRIEAVEREIREVHAGLAAGRRARLLILLLVIAFVAAIFWMFYSLYARVTSEAFMTEMQTAAQTHLEENQEIYADEAQKLADFATPVLTEAFKTTIEKDMPRYTAALDDERKQLTKSLQPKIEGLVNDKYAEVLASFEQTLGEKFPEAKDPVVQERVMANVDKAVKGLVEKYYVKQFKTQMTALDTSWEGFPVADAPVDGEAPLADQLIGLLFEIMTQKLANPPGEAAI